MSRVFYDDIINWSEIEAAVATLTKDPIHRTELTRLADELFHYAVFTKILSLLPDHAHDYFVLEFRNEPHAERHWQFLRTYHPEADRHLEEAVADTHRKFIDTIHHV